MKETLAVVAGLLALAGNIPYMVDVVRGRAKPHPYTWFVGSVVSGIIFFGQLASGAGVGVIPTAASELCTMGIFLLSLRYGFKEITRTDGVFLTLAILCIFPWLLLRDPTLSVVMAVTIDLIAFGPALRKTWQHPQTETPILYGSNVLRHLLALGSLQAYNIATMLHSLAMITTNSIMTAVILLKQRGKKRPL